MASFTYYAQGQRIIKSEAEERAGAGLGVGLKYHGHLSAILDDQGLHRAHLSGPWGLSGYLGCNINRGPEVLAEAQERIAEHFAAQWR